MRNLYPEIPTGEELAIILKEFAETQGIEHIPGLTYSVIANTSFMDNLKDSMDIIGDPEKQHTITSIGKSEVYGRKLHMMFTPNYNEPLTIIAMPSKEPIVRYYFPELANELAEEE